MEKHNGRGAHKQPSACLLLVSESVALQVDLRDRCGRAYRIHHVAPQVLLEQPGRELDAAVAAAAAVIVDWGHDLAAVILATRHIAAYWQVPLFALCGAADADHVAALVIGADDTLARPLRPALLEARLVAYRRLMAGLAPPDEASRTPGVAVAAPEGWALDAAARTCHVHGREVKLTPREFDLLSCFAAHPGVCLARQQILRQVWGITFETGTNMLDVHIFGLRRKLKAYGLDTAIQTVRGVGFRFVMPAETAELINC